MAMILSLTNIFQFISALAPLLLGFYLVLNSIVEQNIKGLVYLAGAVLASIVNILLMNFIESPKSLDASPICNLVEIPFAGSTLNLYNSPAMNSTFIGFTTSYLYIPMAEKKILNYALMLCLLVIFGMDAVSQVQNKCTTYMGVAFGGCLGLLLGYGWYSVISRTSKDLVFLNTSAGNNLICNKLKRQRLRCQVKSVKGDQTTRQLGAAIRFKGDESGDLVVNRNIFFDKDADISGNLDVSGNLDLSGNLDVSGNANIMGNNLTTNDIIVNNGKTITTDGTTSNLINVTKAETAETANKAKELVIPRNTMSYNEGSNESNRGQNTRGSSSSPFI